MQTNSEFSAGNKVFALFLCLFLLGLFGLWLGFHPKSPFRPYRVYRILFPEIGTLREGSPLQILGLRKGVVHSIELRDNGILVVVKVNRDIRIPKDSHFRVINTGLLGQREVEIKPGQSKEYLESGDSLSGGYDAGSTRLAYMVNGLLHSTDQLLTATLNVWDSTLGDPTVQGRLGRLKSNSTRTEANLRRDVGHWIDSLRETQSELKRCADQVNALQKDVSPGIDTVVANAHDLGDGLDSLSLRLQSLQSQISGVASKLDKGNPNSASLLLHNVEMRGQVSTIVTEAQRLLKDIKRKGLDMNVDIF